MSVRKLKAQFYRRPLPKVCISFASEEGRGIFKEALNAGYMTCFFKLSAQFRTQDEPAYCGLTSLIMALNVLEIDPGRVWKGPWRWYHEDMLDCCISLDVVKEKGINMEQFVCLAKCNNLHAVILGAMQFQSLDELRTLVKEKTQLDNEVVIVSYSRAVLGQTGDGHFSPIAGYHESRDLVLILDTARFKYPPYWIPLSLLMKSMQTADSDTGLHRGIVVLSRAEAYVGSLLFRLSCSFVVSHQKGTLPPQLMQFSETWNLWLDENKDEENAVLGILIFLNQFLLMVLKYLCESEISIFCLVMQCNMSEGCDSLCCNLKSRTVSFEEEKQIRCIYSHLLNELESLKTFQIMKEIVSSLPDKDRVQLLKLVECNAFFDCCKSMASNNTCVYQNCHGRKYKEINDCCGSDKECSVVSFTLDPESILTVLFLIWPINKTGAVSGSKRQWLNSWMKEDLLGSSKQTIRSEVLALHVKVVEVLNYHSNDVKNKFSLSDIA